ncbi:MAG TPA: SURF1 family protein [Caldimonas sp.]|nr:SURF1 family protein [Caldimonas sp.]
MALSPRGRAAVVLIAALAFAALCTRLGIWQLDRAQAKLDLQARIEARRSAPVLDGAALASSAIEAAAQYDRPVRLVGHWQPSATVFLDNRQMHGVPGFFVVTPLWLAGRDVAVAVQRGWVPRNPQVRTALPAVPTPSGDVVVEGHVGPPPSRLPALGPDASGPIRQNLDLAAYAQEARVRLLPLSVRQIDSAATRGDGLVRDWPAPAVDVGMHYGYAAQWFAFAALSVGLYVWFQIVRPRLASR